MPVGAHRDRSRIASVAPLLSHIPEHFVVDDTKM
jgi:hypothetical protein